MKFILPVACLIFAITVFSCNEDDPGPQVTKEHLPGFFASIELQTSSDVTLHSGVTWSVLVEGKESDVEDTEVFVSDGTLHIREHGSIDKDQHIRIFMPFFYSLKNYGSSTINSDVSFSSEIAPFYLQSFGSGDISLQLEADFIRIKNFGSGDLSITGQSDSTDIESTGSGWVRTFSLPANKVDVLLTGSGSVEVTANQQLDVVLTGSGNVFYKGAPAIVSQITGSGRLEDAN